MATFVEEFGRLVLIRTLRLQYESRSISKDLHFLRNNEVCNQKHASKLTVCPLSQIAGPDSPTPTSRYQQKHQYFVLCANLISCFSTSNTARTFDKKETPSMGISESYPS